MKSSNDAMDMSVGQIPIPFPERKSLTKVLDEFKLVLFILNLILTIVIIVFYETKPRDYPTLSQQYYRSKMYEPHLDVKYLLQYKEFKVYALISTFLLAAVNLVISLPEAFLFVEAQNKMYITDIMTVWCPMLQIVAILASAFVIVYFGQTNQSYKMYFMGLIGLFIISNVLGLISFITKSAGFFAFCIMIL